MKFCPKCGKNTEELINDICYDCYFEKNDILEGFKETSIELCKECDSIKTNRWMRKAHEESILRFLKDNVKAKKGTYIENINVEYERPTFEEKGRETTNAKIQLTAEVDGNELNLEYDMPIEWILNICPHCQKMNSGYFEGNLQIRPRDHPYFEDVLEYIGKEVQKVAKDGVKIADIEELKEGVDFFLTNKRYMKILAGKIVDKFGGHMKSTAKLFSEDHQTSKQIFRSTILVRLLEWEPGDIIIIKNKILMISRTKKHSVFGFDLDNNKKTNYNYKQFKPEVVCKRKDMEEDNHGNLTFEYNDKTYTIPNPDAEYTEEEMDEIAENDYVEEDDQEQDY